MEKFFYNLGRKVGTSVKKGKWYYKSIFGSEEEVIKAEYMVGKELAANIQREMKIFDDAAAQEIVTAIGNQLRTKVYNKQRAFSFQIISASELNAFALPGGFIFVTKPLLDSVTNNRDELAFILAHEIMHVVLKHPMSRILADYSTQIILNVIFRGGTLGMLAKQILGDLLRKNYSRENEFETDDYAVRLMYSAGFNPQVAETLLDRLKQSSPADLPAYNYFLSHPSIDERIEKINAVIKERRLIR